MEMIIAGVAAATAGAICNPLEVVKIRMQLQGELQARGKYAIHYKNVFHAFYQIASKDGFFALQKGICPFILYQFSANSVRLGLFQLANQNGLTRNSNGTVNAGKTLFYATSCGALGGVACSPFYLVKTHLQSKANEIKIAVGHQHQHDGTLNAFYTIYKQYGFKGLWRGMSSMVPRIAVTSATQLTSFEVIHEFTKKQLPDKIWTPLCLASFGTGFFMTLGMAPFDVIATRFYNQGLDSNGKGLFYRSAVDCAVKTFQKEGVRGFFKGWTACYFRLGPYTMLVMVIWDRLKNQHQQYLQRRDNTNGMIELHKNVSENKVA